MLAHRRLVALLTLGIFLSTGCGGGGGGGGGGSTPPPPPPTEVFLRLGSQVFSNFTAAVQQNDIAFEFTDDTTVQDYAWQNKFYPLRNPSNPAYYAAPSIVTLRFNRINVSIDGQPWKLFAWPRVTRIYDPIVDPTWNYRGRCLPQRYALWAVDVNGDLWEISDALTFNSIPITAYEWPIASSSLLSQPRLVLPRNATVGTSWSNPAVIFGAGTTHATSTRIVIAYGVTSPNTTSEGIGIPGCIHIQEVRPDDPLGPSVIDEYWLDGYGPVHIHETRPTGQPGDIFRRTSGLPVGSG